MFSLNKFYLKTVGRILPSDLFAPRFPVSQKGICIIDGKVILVLNEHGEWDLPGGKLGKDESLEQGLIREMKEELGIDVIPVEVIDILLVNVRGLLSVLVPVYYCKTEATCEDLVLSNEHFNIQCFDPDELTQLVMAANYIPLIEKVFARDTRLIPLGV